MFCYLLVYLIFLNYFYFLLQNYLTHRNSIAIVGVSECLFNEWSKVALFKLLA